jgi:hypothetical protein
LIALVTGFVFLMTGMLVLDWLVIRTIPPLRRTFA